MTNKTAIITGINGQCAFYLGNLLLDKGYRVYGTLRRAADRNMDFLNDFSGPIELLDMDLSDSGSVNRVVHSVKPTEFYNLAAQSHVGQSFKVPEMTGDVDGLGVTRILEAIREYSPDTRFYQSSTSELFHNALAPQNEDTPLGANSPYAAAKLYAHNMVKIYREAYGIFACAGILFNMESPKRSRDFLTRKVTHWIGSNYNSIVNNEVDEPLKIGNLNACRDWGFAGDYVKAMWLMLQQESPQDYVVGSEITYSVRDFCNASFNAIGITLEWSGVAENEVGRDADSGQVLIKVDKQFYRPLEVPLLLADASKARRELGWEPEVHFKQLVELMVASDIKQFRGRHDHPKNHVCVD